MSAVVRKFKAIIFDLDDTLYPERSYALSGFSAVARWAEGQFGIPHAEGYAELRRLFEAGVRGDTFDRWLEQRGLGEHEVVPEMVRVYRQHAPELAPFPDARPVLNQLRTEHRLALITQGYRPGQQRKLEALALTEYFDPTVIMGEEERAKWKPGQEPFERALSAMEIRGPESAYIGDNPLKDFKGARELGMATVWVRRPEGEHAGKVPPTAEYAPDVEVPDLAAVPAALERLAE